MPHDNKWIEMADLHALGALEAEHCAEFKAHLESRCAVCEDHLRRTHDALGMLAASVPQSVPSPALKTALMERIASEPAPAQAVSAPRRNLGWIAAAALSLAFAGVVTVMNGEITTLGGRAQELSAAVESSRLAAEQNREMLAYLRNPSVTLVRLEGAIAGRPVKGTLLWNASTCNGLFLGEGLDRVPDGKAYEFWVIEKGKPLAAGTFTTDANGNCQFKLPEVTMGHFDQFAITLEAREGAAQPTGPILLSGALPAPAAP